MSAVGSLVVGDAHEVRNPLFAISSLFEAFEAEACLTKHEEFQQYTSAIRREIQRLNDLMQDLLDYGTPTAKKLQDGAIEEVIV